MIVNFKGDFSVYTAMAVTAWIDTHLTDITIMDKPIYIYDCKISKTDNKILVEIFN